MVCDKCEKKLSKVIVPDKWKEGASNTTEGGGRKINENKLLSKKKSWIGTPLEEEQDCTHFVEKECGHLMEIQSALFASNKCIKMVNIVIPVLIVKEYVQCVESKFLTPSYTNRAMYDVDMVDELTSMLPQHTYLRELFLLCECNEKHLILYP
ncbi:hypothetical protein KY290_014680 [Solanum tuberosum]|uniref:Cysteine-rich PDZ-binding protein n=1 Tax=Solanum tuberosum TaxID=4113 RepID=A0ABQ7VSF2_SOLTU|nr:hypothetical protein KY285_014116 [Solanum tuberosum]KAH0770699.1 hypothetical protein KY290_014680 [Solanum tuberosum]